MDSASLSQLEAELDKKRKGFQPGRGVGEKFKQHHQPL